MVVKLCNLSHYFQAECSIVPTTRVPQAPACHPRRWSGAGMVVGMLRGAGIALLEHKKGFLAYCLLLSWFLVSWFLGLWFLGFLVFGFLVFGFLVSKFQSFNDPILPSFHFMCLIDMDLISKMFKNLLDSYSGLLGVRLFQHV